VNAPPTSAQHLSESNDYDRGLAEARSSGKRVLLYFTGSDWCPWCQKMDREVLSTSEFQNFAAPRFVMVTVDFPHESFQTDDEKQRNTALAAKYGVSGYPTLIATDANGQKLTLLDGYPNGGMDAVIGMLKNLPP
jgi:thioredoxin-related protein